MTPKEKAKELIHKYLQVYDGRVIQAKQCALIAVDEIIDAIDWHEYEVPNDQLKFWFEVKEAIVNMQGGEQ